jgi:hypothetical protein
MTLFKTILRDNDERQHALKGILNLTCVATTIYFMYGSTLSGGLTNK